MNTIFDGIAPYETLEFHEIIGNEIICCKKLEASLLMVKDPQLKSYMQNSLHLKKDRLNTYKAFYYNSERKQ